MSACALLAAEVAADSLWSWESSAMLPRCRSLQASWGRVRGTGRCSAALVLVFKTGADQITNLVDLSKAVKRVGRGP